MKNLALPFDKAAAQNILAEYGSPLHIYDEKGLRAKAKNIKQAFSWNSGYKNYFAVKAAPTPALLKIMHPGHGVSVTALPAPAIIRCTLMLLPVFTMRALQWLLPPDNLVFPVNRFW